MSISQAPNVAADLIRMHMIITRALNVAIEKGRSFAHDGYPNATVWEGFIAYVRTLASALHAHHLTEEDLAFPYFRNLLPEAPFDLLIAQHREIVGALHETNAALDDVAAEPHAGGGLKRLTNALTRLADLWHPHIRVEENHFAIDRLGPLLDQQEHRRLGGMFAEHGQKHASPDFLVVPFLLYNLPEDERAVMAQIMPPVVMQQLVPVVWKEKWEPMKPFLLP